MPLFYDVQHERFWKMHIFMQKCLTYHMLKSTAFETVSSWIIDFCDLSVWVHFILNIWSIQLQHVCLNIKSFLNISLAKTFTLYKWSGMDFTKAYGILLNLMEVLLCWHIFLGKINMTIHCSRWVYMWNHNTWKKKKKHNKI